MDGFGSCFRQQVVLIAWKIKKYIKIKMSRLPNCFLIPLPILLRHKLLIRVGSALLHSRKSLITILFPPMIPPDKLGMGDGVLSWGICAWLGCAVVPCVTPLKEIQLIDEVHLRIFILTCLFRFKMSGTS